MTQRTDVVEHGSFKLFMFKDDLAYASIPEPQRNKGATLVGRPPTSDRSKPPADVNEYIRQWTPSSSVADRLLAHFVKTWEEFTVVDIGCQYGTNAMSVAQFINSFGGRNQVFAFDCGIAGELTARNIAINGYQEQVHFYPYAVGGQDGFFLMNWQAGHSEDNNIARIIANDTIFSRPVQGVALDSFAAKMRIAGPVFVKIDTQGVEDAVFQGMQTLLREQIVAGVTEFTPWVYRNRGVGLGFIQDLMQTHLLFDTGICRPASDQAAETTAGLRQLTAEDYEGFVKLVDESPAKWTDLIFIPKNMPNLDELLRAFRPCLPDSGNGFNAAA